MGELRPLRPKQALALEALRQAVRDGYRRIVLQAPCAFGKTVVSAHMIAASRSKGKFPLFCVPRLSLINQTIERFHDQGIARIGVIQGRHELTDFTMPVQVASVQTLVRRELPQVDLVMMDEVHLQNEKMGRILDSPAWADKVVIGLSATPWAKGMGLRWKKLVIGSTMQEMIEAGFSTPVVAYGVPDEFMPEVSNIHLNFDGDYVEGEAAEAMTTKRICGNVIETWLKRGPGERTFMFCVNRNHARRMQKEFEDAGVACGYIDGTMDIKEREQIFSRYRSGEIKILSSIDTVGIGIDEDVRCIIYLRLTKSEMRWVQDCGRGIRLAPGKDHLLLLDHAGTAETLGMFTEVHHERLDDRDPRLKGAPFEDDPKPALPRTCQSCYAIISRNVTVCPACGAIQGKCEIKKVGGELKLIGSKKPPAEERQAFYSEALGLAFERGYSIGWAAHLYKDKYGTWPNCLDKSMMVPSPALRRYVRDRALEYRSRHDGSTTCATA